MEEKKRQRRSMPLLILFVCIISHFMFLFIYKWAMASDIYRCPVYILFNIHAQVSRIANNL